MNVLANCVGKKAAVILSLLIGCQLNQVQAGCCDHTAAATIDAEANLILEGLIVSKKSHRLASQKIVTDVTVEVIEVFKGETAASSLVVRMPGGRVGNESQFSSLHLQLEIGMDYMLRLHQKAGTWHCLGATTEQATADTEPKRKKYRQARKASGKKSTRKNLTKSQQANSSVQSMDVIDVSPENQAMGPGSYATVAGYFTFNGAPGRFTACDDGSPILYLVDTEVLPTGISQAQALQAVGEALAAWENVSGLKFKYEGSTVFGQPAGNITTSDEKLRIQLHDKYNAISSSSTLGIGGGSISSSGSFPNGGLGGNVAGQEFQKRTRGHCTLNHRSSSMSTYTTFVEVLTHELGHALGLRHSSESPSESDTNLLEAVMYYQAHSDGRGASLGIYDNELINYGYPATNMPPHGVDRIFYAITGSPQPTGVGVDRITVTGGDQETPTSLSAQVLLGSATSNNGSFSSPASTTIVYTPNGAFSDFSLSASQIATGFSYDRVSYRISDGVNLSPHYSLRIVGMKRDNYPSDELPDSWMTANFGTATAGALGDDRHPDSDPDFDGITNRMEYLYGSDPNDANSGAINFVYDHSAPSASWDTINYMPYILECSTDLTTWNIIRAVEGSGSTKSVGLTTPTGDKQFYRIRLKP